MTRLQVIGSGSKGNAYILKCGNESLIIELGLPWKEIMSHLNYNIGDVVAAICSHEHQDHANKETIKKAIFYGIDVYSCHDVSKTNKGVKELKKGQKTSIGGFKIQPIPLKHSCECYGFLIEHNDMGRLVFATDCSSFNYRIKDVNYWMIESNWSEEVLIDNFCNDDETRSRHEQHLEINDTIRALKENFSSSTNAIILLHLSDGNSDAELFKKKIIEELGFFNVYVAEKGLSLQLEDDF